MAISVTPGVTANPFLSAVGSQIGLDPLFAAAAVKPGKSPSNNPSVSADSRAMSQYRFMERTLGRPGEAPRGGSGNGGAPMLPQGTPDPAVMQSPDVQGLLHQFGVNGQQPIDPHLFIHNPAAWQKHPVLSGLIENGLSGLAFTKPADSVGEGLTNVAQSLLTNKAAHDAAVTSQMNMPFEQAGQVAGLQKDAQSLQNLRDTDNETNAHINYFNALANKANNPADAKAENPLWTMQRNLFHSMTQDYANAHGGQQPDTAAQQDIYNHVLTMTATDKRAPEDPHKAYLGKYYDSVHSKLITQYGSDDKIPPQAWLGGLTDELKAESTAKQAGKPARVSGSGRSGGNPNGPQQRAYQSQINNFNQRIRAAQGTGALLGDDGNMLIPGTDGRTSYLKDLIQKRDAVQGQLNDLVSPQSGAASRNAQPPRGNPSSGSAAPVGPPPDSVFGPAPEGALFHNGSTTYKKVNGKPVLVK